MPTQLLTIDGTAHRTGFASKTIYRMARQVRIPAIRIGRSIRFDTDAIEKWLAKQPKASS